MSKTYLPYDPDQQLLLPAALQEWMPQDHLAYFISDVVDQLDLSAITARDEDEKRGGPPYHPRMMVKVLLYGYCTGVASSRRMAQRLREDIAFRVLAANNTPDFRTVSDFRDERRHPGAAKPQGRQGIQGAARPAGGSSSEELSYGNYSAKSSHIVKFSDSTQG